MLFPEVKAQWKENGVFFYRNPRFSASNRLDTRDIHDKKLFSEKLVKT